MYTKSSHEMEEIEVRIEKAYKKVWMLKCIGSKRIQINPMTFSKGYWAAIVSKACYGLFLTSIKSKTVDRLDKLHVDIARNIQGMASNTPAIVALAGMKWWRLSIHIARDTLMFTWQILSFPMNSLYKQILVYRLVERKELHYSTDQTGPVAEIVRILKVYNMIEHINSFIENGIVMSKSEWKR